MKKIFPWLMALTATILTSCTLYMDDVPTEESPKRVGEGYTTEIKVADEDGYVKYKYSQQTIAVDDEVEKYITKVENDTVFYFSEDTPREYLPAVGEMLACGQRERFPIGLGNKVLEREKVDGKYRVVTTLVDDIFDLFEELEYEITRHPKGLDTISEESKREAAEFIRNLEVAENEGVEAGSRRASFTDDPKDPVALIDEGGKDDYLKLELKLAEPLSSADGKPIQATLNLDVSFYAGMLTKEYANKSKKIRRNEYHFVVGANGTLHYDVVASLKLRTPFPILNATIGTPAWFPCISADIGLSVYPFFEPRIKIEGEVGWNGGFGVNVYTETIDGEETDTQWDPYFYSQKGNVSAGFTHTILNVEPILDLNVGFDFEIGAAGEVDLLFYEKKFMLAITLSAYGKLYVKHSDESAQLYNAGRITSEYIKNKKIPVRLYFDIKDEWTKQYIMKENVFQLKKVNAGVIPPFVLANWDYLPQLKEFSIVPQYDYFNLSFDYFQMKYAWSSEIANLPPFFYDFYPAIAIYSKTVYEENKSLDIEKLMAKVTPEYKMELHDGIRNFFSDKIFDKKISNLIPGIEYVACPYIRVGVSDQLKYLVSWDWSSKESLYLEYEPYPFHSTRTELRIANTEGGQGVQLVRCDRGSFRFGDTEYEYKYKFRTDLFADNLNHNDLVPNWGVEFGGTVKIPDFEYTNAIKTLNHSLGKDTKKFTVYSYIYSKRPLENAVLTAKPYLIIDNDKDGKNYTKVFVDKTHTLNYSYDPTLDGKDKKLPEWGIEFQTGNEESVWLNTEMNITTGGNAQGVKIVKIEQGNYEYTPTIEQPTRNPAYWSTGKTRNFNFRYKVRVDLHMENLSSNPLAVAFKLVTKNEKGCTFHTELLNTYIDGNISIPTGLSNLDATLYTYIYSENALFGDGDNTLTVETRRLVEIRENGNFHREWQTLDSKETTIVYSQQLEKEEMTLPKFGAYIYDQTKHLRNGEASK